MPEQIEQEKATPKSYTSLTDLPEDILAMILMHSGPRTATQLAQTCSLFNNLLHSNATWKGFLVLYYYPEHAAVRPEDAQDVAIKHYCPSCDSIKSGLQMFYTGSVCIACEYKNPDNQKRHFHCQSRFNRYRF